MQTPQVSIQLGMHEMLQNSGRKRELHKTQKNNMATVQVESKYAEQMKASDHIRTLFFTPSTLLFASYFVLITFFHVFFIVFLYSYMELERYRVFITPSCSNFTPGRHSHIISVWTVWFWM